jgi:hypothetical protein
MAYLLRLFGSLGPRWLKCFRRVTDEKFKYEEEFATDENPLVSKPGVSGHHGLVFSG